MTIHDQVNLVTQDIFTGVDRQVPVNTPSNTFQSNGGFKTSCLYSAELVKSMTYSFCVFILLSKPVTQTNCFLDSFSFLFFKLNTALYSMLHDGCPAPNVNIIIIAFFTYNAGRDILMSVLKEQYGECFSKHKGPSDSRTVRCPVVSPSRLLNQLPRAYLKTRYVHLIDFC